MNFESPVTAASYGSAEDDVVIVDSRRRRRRLIIGIVVAAVLVIAAVAFFMGSNDGAATDAATGDGAAADGKNGAGAAVVTVIVPGRESVTRLITATGSLAARREMPIGVPGEGGQVTRVLVEPGQWVRAGQTLATIDRAVQAQQANALAAQIRVAEADARLAQAELDRSQALVSRGFVSKADLDRKTATRDAAQARVNVARAQAGEARARTSRLDIRAPAAGLVLTRTVEPGQVVSAGSGVLFRIARGGEMEMLAQLSEDDLAELSVGVPVTVTPVGTTREFAGRVWQLSPVIDPQTRQGTARIAIPYDLAIRPGGFANASIKAGAVSAPVLPESAVQSDAQGSFVYIVGKDNKVARRPVTTGTVTAEGLTITSGLAGTEKVVAYAGGFLNPGETVKPKRAARRAVR